MKRPNLDDPDASLPEGIKMWDEYPLHYAAKFDKTGKSVDTLLRTDLPYTNTDNYGWTPFQRAMMRGNKEAAFILATHHKALNNGDARQLMLPEPKGINKGVWQLANNQLGKWIVEWENHWRKHPPLHVRSVAVNPMHTGPYTDQRGGEGRCRRKTHRRKTRRRKTRRRKTRRRKTHSLRKQKTTQKKRY